MYVLLHMIFFPLPVESFQQKLQRNELRRPPNENMELPESTSFDADISLSSHNLFLTAIGEGRMCTEW